MKNEGDDEYQFDNVEAMMRDPDIEGKTGTEVGIGGGMTLIVLAASDANSRWRMRSEDITNELNRLRNARADAKRQRHYLARIYAECLVIGWKGVKGAGVEIPFSVDACTAFLRKVDDAYAAVDSIVFDTKNFRGQRIETVAAEGKG